MATIPAFEFDILARVIQPNAATLSRPAAEDILKMSFGEHDQQRMTELLSKAKAGELSGFEAAEIESYERINSLLGMLKSKARVSLRETP